MNSTEFDDEAELHRDVTVSDGIGKTIGLTPGTHPPMERAKGTDPKNLWQKRGAALVRMRFFAENTASNGTVNAKLYAFPKTGIVERVYGNKVGPVESVGKGIQLATLAITFGDATPCIDKHPVTGAAVSGKTFYEATSMAETYAMQDSAGSLLVKAISNQVAASTALNCFVYFDTAGFNAFYVEFDTVGGTSPTRLICEMTRVS